MGIPPTSNLFKSDIQMEQKHSKHLKTLWENVRRFFQDVHLVGACAVKAWLWSNRPDWAHSFNPIPKVFLVFYHHMLQQVPTVQIGKKATGYLQILNLQNLSLLMWIQRAKDSQKTLYYVYIYNIYIYIHKIQKSSDVQTSYLNAETQTLTKTRQPRWGQHRASCLVCLDLFVAMIWARHQEKVTQFEGSLTWFKNCSKYVTITGVKHFSIKHLEEYFKTIQNPEDPRSCAFLGLLLGRFLLQLVEQGLTAGGLKRDKGNTVIGPVPNPDARSCS